MSAARQEWSWFPEHSKYSESLKAAIKLDIMLAYPDLDKGFLIAIDASVISTGETLYQQKQEVKNIIEFASK